MSHLARQHIKARLQGAEPLVTGAPPESCAEFDRWLQPDSVDLRIGVVVADGIEVVDGAHPVWQLPAGEMATIITREKVRLGSDLGAEVSPRQSVLDDGLLVLAASHVDPGYSGPLKARVINLLDKPYRLSADTSVLTVRFYELKEPTQLAYQENVGDKVKLEKALKESRDTFNRLFLREEDVVLRKDLRSAAAVEALTWLALIVPATAVVLPFSIPFFWSLGADVAAKQPTLVWPVVVISGLLLVPLLALYVRLIPKLWRLIK